jgi:hypothetical protein
MTLRFIRLCSALHLLFTAATWARADGSPKRLLPVASKAIATKNHLDHGLLGLPL